MGVWAPKKWDMSVHAVAQYTVPKQPPENPWIDRSRSKSRPGTPGTVTPPLAPASIPASSSSATPAARVKKPKKDRRPPSRKLIRHVLRARIEAAKSLASLFNQLEHSDKRVRASSHLARAFSGQLDPEFVEMIVTEEGATLPEEPTGWRNASEVLAFLNARGAKIRGLYKRVEGEWAAVSSEGEGEMDQDSTAGSGEDIVWVSPERQ